VTFDSVLNVIWLVLGFIAVASTIRIAFGMRGKRKQPVPWLHVIVVGLIVIALFPYVSATDDVVQLEHAGGKTGHGHTNSQTRTNESLIRLYETMDTPLVSHVCRLTLTLVFAWIVLVSAPNSIERIAPFRAGRSPPLPFPA
jgi:hypothetical protein